jgi:hypothetical protein
MIKLTFQCALSAHALSYETLSDLVPTLQRLPPTGKAAPLYLDHMITAARGLLLSWAFQPLRLSPLSDP